jgi:Single-strand binding protein family
MTTLAIAEAPPPQFQVITLVGNLTADPVIKQLDGGRKVCQLRIAVNDVKDQPMFIDVATFGAQADACAKYLAKGARSGLPAGWSIASGTSPAPVAAATMSSAASSSAASPAASRPRSPRPAMTRRASGQLSVRRRPPGRRRPHRRHL